MFQRILIPLDGSVLAECVLPHAVLIARAFEPEVILLRVQDPAGQMTRPRPVDPLEWQIRKAEGETYLEEIASRLQSVGIHPRIEIREGKAAQTIIQFAQQQDVDLILMSSHGQSGLSPWNVSSVVQQVILRAHRSIMIVRAYEPPVDQLDGLQYRRVLVPLDCSARAEAVLPIAESLARFYDFEILVAHSVRLPEIPRRTTPTQEDQDLADRLTERNQEEAEKYLAELKSRLSKPVETRLLVSDKTSLSLHILVEDEKVDLVLMSAHGYSGDPHWPYGSVVVSFIIYGSTPLLIFQDLPEDQIEPTRAELEARRIGGR
jgi:nucleotide-binding universal stress UspA family protein